jgi:hypothetical protein
MTSVRFVNPSIFWSAFSLLIPSGERVISTRRVPGTVMAGMVSFDELPGGFRSVPDTRRNKFFAQQKRSCDFSRKNHFAL